MFIVVVIFDCCGILGFFIWIFCFVLGFFFWLGLFCYEIFVWFEFNFCGWLGF